MHLSLYTKIVLGLALRQHRKEEESAALTFASSMVLNGHSVDDWLTPLARHIFSRRHLNKLSGHN